MGLFYLNGVTRNFRLYELHYTEFVHDTETAAAGHKEELLNRHYKRLIVIIGN